MRRRKKVHDDLCLCRFPLPTYEGRCSCGGYMVSSLIPTVAEKIYRQTPELRKQCV